MDRRAHGKIILILYTLTIRGSDTASLVEIPPSGLGGDSDGQTDRRMEALTTFPSLF